MGRVGRESRRRERGRGRGTGIGTWRKRWT